MKNKKLMQKLDILMSNSNNSIAIFDFDYTLTLSNSNSSIGVFTNYLPNQYKIFKKRIDYLTNRINNKHVIKILWWIKLKKLAKYYSIDLLDKINYKNEFYLNINTINILKDLVNNNVDVIIYSSGLKSVILNILNKNNIDTKNIKIFANDINVNTKKINKKIITPKNKEIRKIEYKYVILFGDKIEDLKIIKNSFKVLVNDYSLEMIGV